MHTYQPSLQHVQFDVRSPRQERKKERILIFTEEEHLMGGGRGLNKARKAADSLPFLTLPPFLTPHHTSVSLEFKP